MQETVFTSFPGKCCPAGIFKIDISREVLGISVRNQDISFVCPLDTVQCELLILHHQKSVSIIDIHFYSTAVHVVQL